MFKKLEEKAKQMIANGEEDMALTMWIDGHYVTAVVTITRLDQTAVMRTQDYVYNEMDNNPDQYGY